MNNAAKILDCNKENLAGKYSDYIKATHATRTTDISKCFRDISIILSAYVNDLEYNTDMQTRYITSQFFKNNLLQLRSVDVEIEVHNMILNDIKNLFQKHNEIIKNPLLLRFNHSTSIFMWLQRNGRQRRNSK